MIFYILYFIISHPFFQGIYQHFPESLLYQVKGLLADDRFMSILENLPFLLRIVDDLMNLVGLHVCLEIDRVTAVFQVFKYMGDRIRSPAVQWGKIKKLRSVNASQLK